MKNFINTTLNSPPRPLSTTTYISVLLGGLPIHIISIVFWISTLLLVQITLNSELIHSLTAWEQTEGVLIDIIELDTDEDEDRLFEYTASYIVKGESYHTTSLGGVQPYLVNGVSLVAIEYKADNPSIARLKNTHLEYHSTAAGIIVLIIFLIDFILLSFFLIKRNKLIYLLEKGNATRGVLTKSMATNTSINEETVYAYEFTFHHNGKKFKAKGNTHHYNRVENEDSELILYQEENPKNAIIYDIYSFFPSINNHGEIIPASFSDILPAVFINGLGFFFVFIF